MEVKICHFLSRYKVIDGGKYSKERPDFLFDEPLQTIIVEIDENQHFSNPCEQIRMVNIFNSVKKPTIFIRYKYTTKDDNGAKIGENYLAKE